MSVSTTDYNLTNQKLGLGYISSIFNTIGIDDKVHPNPRIRDYKFDVINLGTLRNVIPTAVLRKNIYGDIVFSRRKQWGFQNIIIKNDQKLYEVISELSVKFYGDYSYFAPYKIRFYTLDSNFFQGRLSTAIQSNNIDRSLPYTRVQFPSNISNSSIISGVRASMVNFDVTGINFARRNTFIYRRFNNVSGYLPYPQTLTTWQYPTFNLDTVIAPNSLNNFKLNDMKGLLTVTLRNPSSGQERLVYVSPHGVAERFYNTYVDTLKLQLSRIQSKASGRPPSYEYVKVLSGITVPILDIDSEYYKESITPTPFARFEGTYPLREISYNSLTGLTVGVYNTPFSLAVPNDGSGAIFRQVDEASNPRTSIHAPIRVVGFGTPQPITYTQINGRNIATLIPCTYIYTDESRDRVELFVQLSVSSGVSGLQRQLEPITRIETNSGWYYKTGPILANILRNTADASLCYYQISPSTNNRLLITNPELGLRINVSGCWGGYEAVWESSANGTSWSGFDMYEIYRPLTGWTYNGTQLFGPETTYPTGWRGAASPCSNPRQQRSYSGQIPLNHKFLRVTNPQNVFGGGTILVSVSAYTGKNIFEEGLVKNLNLQSGQSLYRIANRLQQTTPLRDTWYYKFYSGLYSNNKIISTGTWDGIIPSGQTATIEYIVTKDGRFGTDNEFKLFYKNYGDNSYIDRSLRNTYTNTFSYSSGSSGVIIVEDSITKRGFGMSPSLKTATTDSNNNLRKGINIVYNNFKKFLPSGVEVFKENSAKRRFRNLYTTNNYDYRTFDEIPVGAYGCFRLQNKQIVCIDPKPPRS